MAISTRTMAIIIIKWMATVIILFGPQNFAQDQDGRTDRPVQPRAQGHHAENLEEDAGEDPRQPRPAPGRR